MRPQDLVVRCYAETHENQWQAICIDLNLAAQGDSFEDAREKLTEQILDYLEDALVGEDKEFAGHLLNRPAPLEYRLKYHWHHARKHINHGMHKALRAFELSLPMVPQKLG